MQSIDQKGPNESIESPIWQYCTYLQIYPLFTKINCRMPSARFRKIGLWCITRQRHRRDNSSQERSMCFTYFDAALMPCHTINYSRVWFTEKLVSSQKDVLAVLLSINESIISPLPTVLQVLLRVTSVSKLHCGRSIPTRSAGISLDPHSYASVVPTQ